MEIYNLGNKRHLCWDDMLVDKKESVTTIMHKPEKKEIALVCDNDWEGNENGYASVFKDGDEIKFYYRAANHRVQSDGSFWSTPTAFCLATSKDGKSFKKPILNKCKFVESTDNNIYYSTGGYVDNFTPMKDTNPNCKKEEAYKAISSCNVDGNPRLALFISADGINFERKKVLDLHGAFDTYNILFWDEKCEEYRIYYRGNHEMGNRDVDTSEVVTLARPDLRDVRLATTKDFETIEVKGILDYTKEDDDNVELYTNHILRYYRADHVFLGMPSRYIDRKDDAHNYEHLPQNQRHAFTTKHYGREGTAITDCVLMTSHDGFTFERQGEAFLTPGIEAADNWWYGDCFPVYGLIETESDTPGAPNEISFYVGEGYRMRNVHFRRYTMRLDGFFSWNGPYCGGYVVTKPFTFEGNELEINFATSALGGVTITVCDENGNPIDGYTSKTHFGDSVCRKIAFDKPLCELAEKAVKLKIELKDAHIYSFKFN